MGLDRILVRDIHELELGVGLQDLGVNLLCAEAEVSLTSRLRAIFFLIPIKTYLNSAIELVDGAVNSDIATPLHWTEDHAVRVARTAARLETMVR